jgi:putative membrane protein
MLHGTWYGMGVGVGWMWLVWAIVLVALVTLFVLAAKGLRHGAGGRETPEEILKRRYALGEVDQVEYRKRLHDLRQ